MLKGGLETEPLHSILIELGESKATGCLQVNDSRGDEGLIYLKDGLVYSVTVSNLRPALGPRLLSSGTLTPDALADAMEAQRFELRGWRLGELLVHLGYVEQEVVERYIDEQVNDGFAALLSWPSGTWKFRNGRRTREDVAPSRNVADLIAHAELRNNEQAALLEAVHGPSAVPTLSTTSDRDGEIPLDPDAWSLLCKIDGVRSITELAHDCGFSLLEAGQVIHTLVRAGLVDIHESVDEDTRPSEPILTEDRTEDRTAAIIAALSGSGPMATPAEAATDVATDVDDQSEADLAVSVKDLLAPLFDSEAAQHPSVEAAAFEADPYVQDESVAPVTRVAAPVVVPAFEPDPLPGPGIDDVPEPSDSVHMIHMAEAETEPAEPTEPPALPSLLPELITAAVGPTPTSIPVTAVQALAVPSVLTTEIAAEEPAPEPTDTDAVDTPDANGYDPDSYDPAELASASALLAEFNQLTTSTPDAHDTHDEPSSTRGRLDPAATPADEPDTVVDIEFAYPTSPKDMADTASLLRELSSLGADDSASPAPAAHGVRQPAPAQPKKRKGLFGR